MDIIVSNTSGEPIYQQIVTQVKALIVGGRLKEGDPLPSMRTLAQELRISVITTKRAYEELEKEGFIVSYTGKGSYVKGQNLELIREENLKQIEVLLTQAVEKSKLCNVSLEELSEILRLIYDET